MALHHKIEVALRNMGGEGTLVAILVEVGRLYPETPTRGASVRNAIYTHSSDSEYFPKSNGKDMFYSVYGIRSGVWGLRFFKPFLEGQGA